MTLWGIITLIIAGLIIGVLARWIMPGRQNINIWLTILFGIAGSLGGAWLYTALSGNSGTSGIDWIALILGVIVAIVLIAIYGSITGRKR